MSKRKQTFTASVAGSLTDITGLFVVGVFKMIAFCVFGLVKLGVPIVFKALEWLVQGACELLTALFSLVIYCGLYIGRFFKQIWGGQYEQDEELEDWQYDDELDDEGEDVTPLLPEVFDEDDMESYPDGEEQEEEECYEEEEDEAPERYEGEDELVWYPGGSPERAIEILERRLECLYERKDKAEYVNKVDDATWKKYQTTKAWRGLIWEIERTEEKLEWLEEAV